MPTAGTPPRKPRPTIDELMAAYLAETSPKAARRRGRHHVEGSLELLRHGLNGYGHQYVSRADAERAQQAFDDGDEDAFCRMFGATVLVKYLDEFLGYFLIRKVMLSEDGVAQAIEDVRGFVEWLARNGAITPAAARKSLGHVATASVDVPAAERLSQLLYELGRVTSERAAAEKASYEEIVEDYVVVERVAPGRIWFLNGVGPIKVPDAASALARPGWTINVVLGKRGSTWDVLEVGNVYPETLA